MSEGVVGVMSELQWNCNSNLDILPTDDQLDELVDSLCDNFHTSKVQHDFNRNSTSSSLQDLIESNDIAVAQSQDTSLPVNTLSTTNTESKNSLCQVDVSPLSLKDSIETDIFSDKKSTKNLIEKRGSTNSNLNLSIMRCTTNLENLIEKRMNLEALAQHKVKNNNFAFSYTSRLPDCPTRVDRLMSDINQERYKIFSLIATLDKTINSFSSPSTKNELRQLLTEYGEAISEVIKNRQNEINCSRNGTKNEAVVLKLIQSLDRVNRLTKKMYTALWCIGMKEQIQQVKSQKSAAKNHPALQTIAK